MAAELQQVDETQIRQLLDDWTRAVQAKDIDRLMSFYASDIVAFDMIPPLWFAGKEAYRENWEMGFEMCTEQGEFETRDLSLTVSDEAAFCYRLMRMSGTTKEGEPFDNWTRWTTCFKKINGRWLIVHEHISVPFDMQTGKALMGLKP